MKLEEYKKLYKEEFRPIKLGNGFDKYEVSNYGNFRLIGRNKNVKLTIQKNGYHSARTKASKEDNVSRRMNIHRLVAYMFLPKPDGWDESWEVDHLDSDKNNNNPTNLEWVTAKENIKRSVINGNRKTKYSVEQAKKICEYLANKALPSDTLDSVSERFNVEKELVESIYNRRRWNVLLEDYPQFKKLASDSGRSEELIEEICSFISNNKTLSNQKTAAHFNSLYPNLLKPIGSTLISSLKNKKIYKKISDKYFKDVISNSRNKRTPND